jgi:hypothetical protein
MDEEKEISFLAALLDMFISLSHGPCGVMFISLFHEKKRNEPKRKFAGLIPEAKNRIIFPKTSKRPPLRSGWTVLVSLRKNNPIFFTPLERGRNLITGSETVRTFVPFDCPIQRSHPVVQSNAPIQWSNPPFPSSCRDAPTVRPNTRTGNYEDRGTTLDWPIQRSHPVVQPNVPIQL